MVIDKVLISTEGEYLMSKEIPYAKNRIALHTASCIVNLPSLITVCSMVCSDTNSSDSQLHSLATCVPNVLLSYY